MMCKAIAKKYISSFETVENADSLYYNENDM